MQSLLRADYAWSLVLSSLAPASVDLQVFDTRYYQLMPKQGDRSQYQRASR